MCDLLRSFNKIKPKKSDSYITITSTICPNNSNNFSDNIMATIRSRSVCSKMEILLRHGDADVQNGFRAIVYVYVSKT